jgi:hypothetical protein
MATRTRAGITMGIAPVASADRQPDGDFDGIAQ